MEKSVKGVVRVEKVMKLRSKKEYHALLMKYISELRCVKFPVRCYQEDRVGDAQGPDASSEARVESAARGEQLS